MTVNKQYQGICYHAQQMSEKVIKALWKETIPTKNIAKTHDIQFLLFQLKEVCNLPSEFFKFGKYLSKYASDFRYDFLEKIDESQVITALHYSKQLYDWALNMINEIENSKKS